jgi:hypothetical protein
VNGEKFAPPRGGPPDAGELDGFWENYSLIDDITALEARESAIIYARERLKKTGIGGMMADVVAAEFGMYVYAYTHFKTHLFSPGEWEREFREKLDIASPVWVQTPYGKKDRREVMRYGEIRYGELHALINYRKVWVCTGPYPKAEASGSGRRKA